MNTEKEIQQIKEVLNYIINNSLDLRYQSESKEMLAKLNQPTEAEPKGGYEGVKETKPTDKELLDEAVELLKAISNGIAFNESIDKFLNKLKQ